MDGNGITSREGGGFNRQTIGGIVTFQVELKWENRKR
jgi:hypothetical protein